MKIAVSCLGKTMDDKLDQRFGRCSYFVIYDSDKGSSYTLENKGQSSGGGAGIAAAQQIIDEEVEVVITGNMGPNAYNLMKSSEIKVFHCENASCMEAIKSYEDKKLEEISSAGPSHMGMNSGK